MADTKADPQRDISILTTKVNNLISEVTVLKTEVARLRNKVKELEP